MQLKILLFITFNALLSWICFWTLLQVLNRADIKYSWHRIHQNDFFFFFFGYAEEVPLKHWHIPLMYFYKHQLECNLTLPQFTLLSLLEEENFNKLD